MVAGNEKASTGLDRVHYIEARTAFGLLLHIRYTILHYNLMVT